MRRGGMTGADRRHQYRDSKDADRYRAERG
jgi:hypothetical protein